MVFALDHIVFSATTSERDQIVAELEIHGFRPEQLTLVFPEAGARSDSWSFGGGAFVEFVTEAQPGATASPWFGQTPRVIGLGFASDAFDDDTQWDRCADAWRMDERHTLPNGCELRIHAAGPHKHLSDFYVFVMDRPDCTLEFPARRSGPRLIQVTLAGARAEQWRASLRDWLKLPADGDESRVGEVTLAFGAGPSASVRVSLRYEADIPAPARIALAGGVIEIVPAPR